MLRKPRYYMKYSAQYLVFPATFHVISWKIYFFWDSVGEGKRAADFALSSLQDFCQFWRVLQNEFPRHPDPE